MRRLLVIAVPAALALLPLQPQAGDDSVIRVTAESWETVAQTVTRSAPAEVESLQRAPVIARISAPVAQVAVRTGDHVDAGTLLVRLECEDYEDRLEQAQGRLDELDARTRLAENQLQRFRRLHEDQAVSQERLDQATADADATRAARHAQQAAVLASSRDVRRCEVNAPFAGVVTRRQVNAGEFVQSGTPLVQLVDGGSIELSARLAQRDAESLHPENTARFVAGGQEYPVVLRELVADVDSGSRTREARLDFVGPLPLPGTAGRLYWQIAERAVPADLIVRRDDQLGIMVVDDGHARFMPLADAIEGRPAPVDLDPDLMLIVRGRHAVRAGTTITVADDGD